MTFEEKEKMLRKALFQQAEKCDEVWEQKEGGEGVVITEQQVRAAFRSMGGMKAPGKDEIIVNAVKETMDILGERLKETYQVAINNGQHPERWKTAIAAIIPKPGKTDYTSPKSYRPVPLLNTIGKGLEKIVANKVTAAAEKDGV